MCAHLLHASDKVESAPAVSGPHMPCFPGTSRPSNACSCQLPWLKMTVQAISLVFFTETWRPDSFYSRVAANRSRGLHTLVLLDIKVREPSLESLARGKPVYEPPR